MNSVGDVGHVRQPQLYRVLANSTDSLTNWACCGNGVNTAGTAMVGLSTDRPTIQQSDLASIHQLRLALVRHRRETSPQR